ncbi:hypothetical protein CryarDRAFT_3887 [Cryptosporangium arvum DSM 44712]|uniref:Uncharacterized protein n=2 Tax=Cryptosporangium TaxID=65502 RepID=A0A010ZZN6_9ACTN|nr:hypothetical protein CryarDRAFT_3887 [Cryptosporangium arvum DSM 44712]
MLWGATSATSATAYVRDQSSSGAAATQGRRPAPRPSPSLSGWLRIRTIVDRFGPWSGHGREEVDQAFRTDQFRRSAEAVVRAPHHGSPAPGGPPRADGTDDIYTGLAAAGLANFHGRPEYWATAEQRYATVDRASLTAAQLPAYQVLETLVVEHRLRRGPE